MYRDVCDNALVADPIGFAMLNGCLLGMGKHETSNASRRGWVRSIDERVSQLECVWEMYDNIDELRILLRTHVCLVGPSAT